MDAAYDRAIDDLDAADDDERAAASNVLLLELAGLWCGLHPHPTAPRWPA